MQLTHVRLLVDDYPASFRFDRDVLGLEKTFGVETTGIFGVEDVDEVAARLGEHVVGQPQGRAEWGIRFVHVRDPDRNLIERNQQIPMAE